MFSSLSANVRRVVAALFMTVAILLGSVAGANVITPASSTTPVIAGAEPVTNPARLGTESLSFGGCAVRFDGPGGHPRLHTNGMHYCVGVRGVSISPKNGRMVINLVGSQPVISLSATPDETLGGQRGIIVGPSGGPSSIEYNFYDTRIKRGLDLRKTTDRARIKGPYSNLWVSWLRAA